GPTFGDVSPAAIGVPLTATSTGVDTLVATRARADGLSTWVAVACWSSRMAFSRWPPEPEARMTVTIRWSLSTNEGISRRTSLLSPALVTNRWYAVADAASSV